MWSRRTRLWQNIFFTPTIFQFKRKFFFMKNCITRFKKYFVFKIKKSIGCTIYFFNYLFCKWFFNCSSLWCKCIYAVMWRGWVKKLLTKLVARMSRVSELQEHPWQNFTYVSVGVGPLPMRFGLNFKYTHETEISTRP